MCVVRQHGAMELGRWCYCDGYVPRACLCFVLVCSGFWVVRECRDSIRAPGYSLEPAATCVARHWQLYCLCDFYEFEYLVLDRVQL